jgi:hypothetical protein
MEPSFTQALRGAEAERAREYLRQGGVHPERVYTEYGLWVAGCLRGYRSWSAEVEAGAPVLFTAGPIQAALGGQHLPYADTREG